MLAGKADHRVAVFRRPFNYRGIALPQVRLEGCPHTEIIEGDGSKPLRAQIAGKLFIVALGDAHGAGDDDDRAGPIGSKQAQADLVTGRCIQRKGLKIVLDD